MRKKKFVCGTTTIRVSEEVYDVLKSSAKGFETPDAVLRRFFGLEKRQKRQTNKFRPDEKTY